MGYQKRLTKRQEADYDKVSLKMKRRKKIFPDGETI